MFDEATVTIILLIAFSVFLLCIGIFNVKIILCRITQFVSRVVEYDLNDMEIRIFVSVIALIIIFTVSGVYIFNLKEIVYSILPIILGVSSIFAGIFNIKVILAIVSLPTTFFSSVGKRFFAIAFGISLIILCSGGILR